MHLIILPFAIVLSTVGPDFAPLATDLSLGEISSVDRSVWPLVRPLAIFLPELEATIILPIVYISLGTLAMLYILHPVA